jgi:hypothetical protein
LLYPNPTNGALFMELSLDLNSHVQITVLNSAGQQIEFNEYQGHSGNNVFTLDSKNWASGVYIIQATEMRTGEVVRRKIIKE